MPSKPKGIGFGDLMPTAFSPDARRLVSAIADGTVTHPVRVPTLKLWDVARHHFRALELPAGMDFIHAIAFRGDGRQFLTVGWDQTLTTWDFDLGAVIGRSGQAMDGRPASSLAEFDRGPTFLAFSPDGKWLVSGSGDGIVRLYDAATLAQVRTIAGPRGRVHAVAFLPGGIRVVAGGHRRLDERDEAGRLKMEPLVVWDADLPRDPD